MNDGTLTALTIAVSVVGGALLAIIAGLPRAVSLYFARRRNHRLLAGRAAAERIALDPRLDDSWRRRGKR